MFLSLFVSCEADEEVSFRHGTEYFALKKGVFQVYSVNEVHYSAATEPLEINYELRAEVTDSFPSNAGGYTYVIHRSKRVSDTESWQALDTWSVRPEISEVIVTEGNTPYVKVKLPLTPDNVWNGNELNAQGEDQYRYSDIARPLELDGMTFENTITVEQENNEDPIVFRDQRKEVYARNVGLVYKEVVQLNYCTDDACLGQKQVDHGVEMRMTIKDYGKQ